MQGASWRDWHSVVLADLVIFLDGAISPSLRFLRTILHVTVTCLGCTLMT